MSRSVFTVYQINEYVRTLLEKDSMLQQIWIKAEVSNLRIHSSGHIYFTMKDECSKIRCVMFKQRSGLENRYIPSDGSKVLAGGYVSLYSKDGQYQFYVQKIESDGLGDLFIAFEELKKKLSREGIFAASAKKPIPRFPRKIAVITSPTGAAVRDIINVIKRRNSRVDILVVPVAVQGKAASLQISAAIDYINTMDNIDLAIVGRGGGSIEELWAFNEESVARAIHRSRIPIISAVGHETDFSIADLAADLRAPTPSAAGELAVSELRHARDMLASLEKRLAEAMQTLIKSMVHRMKEISGSYVLRYPDRLIAQYQQQVDQLFSSLVSSVESKLESKKLRLAVDASALHGLSPLKVMALGYALVTFKETGFIVRSVERVKHGDAIVLDMADGQVGCRVDDVHSRR